MCCYKKGWYKKGCVVIIDDIKGDVIIDDIRRDVIIDDIRRGVL